MCCQLLCQLRQQSGQQLCKGCMAELRKSKSHEGQVACATVLFIRHCFQQGLCASEVCTLAAPTDILLVATCLHSFWRRAA